MLTNIVSLTLYIPVSTGSVESVDVLIYRQHSH